MDVRYPLPPASSKTCVTKPALYEDLLLQRTVSRTGLRGGAPLSALCSRWDFAPPPPPRGGVRGGTSLLQHGDCPWKGRHGGGSFLQNSSLSKEITAPKHRHSHCNHSERVCVCVFPPLLGQAVLKTSYCGHSLKEEISHLRNLGPLAPPAPGIQASLTQILHHMLSWVEAVESLLRDVGVDASAGETGSYRHLPGCAVAALLMNWAA